MLREPNVESERLGPYELLEKIGDGEAAELYRARHRGGFPLEVALHVVHRGHADEEEFEDRLLEEARLASCLDHPNIARVYEAGIADGRCYLAAELVEGPTLEEIAEGCREQGRPIPHRLLLRILCGVCEGLHWAHELSDDDGNALRLVHGRVSASSILLAPSGAPKIAGFGLALAVAAGAAGPTPDRRADLRALAHLLPNLLSGGDLPEELSSLVRRLDEDEGGSSPSTALALRLELERVLAGDEAPVVDYHVASFLQEMESASSAEATRPDFAPDFARGHDLGAAESLEANDGEETLELLSLEATAADALRPEDTLADRERPPTRDTVRTPIPFLVRFFPRDEEDLCDGAELEGAQDTLYDELAAEILSGLKEPPSVEEPEKARIRRRVGGLLERARRAHEEGSHAAAVVALDLAMEENPKSATAQKVIAEHRQLLLSICRTYLGEGSEIPSLAVDLDDLPLDKIDHRIAFLLSHVDGSLTLEEILSVCGMRDVDALRYLALLRLHGVLQTIT